MIPLMLAALALAASAAEPFTVELLFTHPYVTGTALNNPAWFPDGLASGIYLARVQAGKWSVQQKVVHLK
ncbi:MAG: hypothetical protein C4524_05105 [Candidatus Zixiibacteriota bacterium]|nr:MAG: hypothetical protein C4524_05105 [candidate division Zixibacteria bacterium]